MRIGLALSGGGAKAIAQLGVLQALIDNDLEPSVISASSGGAVTALFYASGHSPEAMVELIMDAGAYAYISPNFKRGGLFNMTRARKYYHRFLDDVTFSDLEIPVYIAATDLRSGKTIYFSEGDVVEPLIASTSIPVLYEPVEYLGHLLTDGSVSNNLPYEPLVGKCDKMIGVLTSGFERDFQSQRNTPDTTLDEAGHARGVALGCKKDYYFLPHLLPAIQRPQQRALVGIFQISSHRQAARQARQPHVQGF